MSQLWNKCFSVGFNIKPDQNSRGTFTCQKCLKYLSFFKYAQSLFHFSLHPSLPIIATASGQRHFVLPDYGSDGEQSDLDDDESNVDNSLKLWWAGPKEWAMIYIKIPVWDHFSCVQLRVQLLCKYDFYTCLSECDVHLFGRAYIIFMSLCK